MRVLADGRVRRTEAEWRGLLARFEKSGLSMSVFCRRAKLPRSSFVKWRRRLAEKASPSAGFVEWAVPSSADEAGAELVAVRAGEFELALPGGVVLRWKA
jgi:hypothetical protein